LKEIKFTPNTQLHDIKHKIAKVPQWLVDGEKVRLSVKFSGREIAHPETGIDLLNQVIELIPEAQVDKSPTLDGKQMWALLSRKSTKGMTQSINVKK
jgi:translation initiation factor IF-3